ncbi:MAG: hypothetical protein FWH12_02280 [Treponema sp.]|nr:hypothetical protein [Treponema sp.]
MTIVYERFESLEDYLTTINTREPNEVFKFQSKSSQKWESEDEGWANTSSYEDADKLAYHGYKEGFDSLMSENAKAQYRSNATKAFPSVEPVGFTPHVPNAIAGKPYSMINRVKREVKDKTVTIVYENGGSAHIDGEEFINAGKMLLNIIYTLETQGYRIGLYTLKCSVSRRSEVACNIVMLKHYRQPLNYLKIAYSLVHPSWLRRHGFKWLETTPGLTDNTFTFGYGIPLRHASFGEYMGILENRQKWLVENKIIEPSWVLLDQYSINEYGPGSEDKIIKDHFGGKV